MGSVSKVQRVFHHRVTEDTEKPWAWVHHGGTEDTEKESTPGLEPQRSQSTEILSGLT